MLRKSFVKRLTDYNNPRSLGSRLRRRRLTPLLALIRKAFAEHGHVSIIDIGGTETYWKIVPRAFLLSHRVRITVVNLPTEEQLSTKEGANDTFAFMSADGCNLHMIEDRSFHIAHSNSVIEHVGDWSRMELFALEIKRVADAYYVQTPYFWFPIEPHCMTPFLHWLPKPVRITLVRRFALGHWKLAENVAEAVQIVESALLLDKKMFAALFENAEIAVERFALLPKSLIAIRAP